ncbi:MAG: hypothetical protein LBV46_03370 [Bacteroidales bacterium]|jgi:beta-mannosidase|nr:hypothetical protein [Bacteroidales bacterium]
MIPLIKQLEERDIKPTAIRLLVLKSMLKHHKAFSMSDLEIDLCTVDKSSIFRTLTLFHEHHLIHSIDDGSGAIKYSVCTPDCRCQLQDLHVHFYCTKCMETTCMENIPIPEVQLPPNFLLSSVNFVLKGLCNKCSKRLIHCLLIIVMFSLSFNSFAQQYFYNKDATHFTQPLDASWQFEYNGQWYPATVPGNIYTDLLANNLILDPFFGTNEDSVHWVAHQEWRYRAILRTFHGLYPLSDYRHISLVFDGINGCARFFLNGQLLSSEETPFYNQAANNAQRRYTFNLSNSLFSKRDTLLIVFAPALEEATQLAKKLPYALPELRAHSRIPPYQAGWDWGPNLPGVGIWTSVGLDTWNDFKISDLQIFSHIYDKDAGLEVVTTIVSDSVQNLTIDYQIENQSVKTDHEVTLQKGVNYIRRELPIKEVKLWYPNEMGEQSLYKVSVHIHGDKREDYRAKTIGVRDISLNRAQDSIGAAFAFVVNGKPIFAKGANWIPADFFPHRMTEERYRNLLQSCKDAHFNMIRVWGGGVAEHDYFYQLCDEMGIMVWQDFMFACALYPADTAFLQNITTEATEQILRLRNHPSLALWCGNNEVKNGWEDWGWQEQYDEDIRAQIGNDQKQIFDTLLPNLVAKLDKDRAYHSSSPLWGWGHKESLLEGDSHYWGVWWGEEPFEVWNSKTGRFMSEFGFQSYPQMSTIAQFTTEADRFLDSPAMKNHQKHGRGVPIIEKAMQQYFHRPNNLEDFVYLSQLTQAIGVGAALETFRLKTPYCMGALYWQLNDCWPVASWSSIDYYGNKKALHYEVARQFAPTIIACDSFFHDGTNIYLVSDNTLESGKIVMQLVDFKGKKIEEKTFDNIKTASNSSTLITHYALNSRYAAKQNKLHLRIFYKNEKNEILAEKVHFFVYPKEMDKKLFNYFTSRFY